MVSKTFKILFILRKRKNGLRGPLPIYVRLTVNGARIELSTSRVCDPAGWNKDAGRAIGNKEDARTLNAYPAKSRRMSSLCPPPHSFTFKGKTYDIKDAVFKNWGPADLVDDGQTSPTHYQNWIIFSDGQITLTGTDIAASNATYIVPLTVVTTFAGNDGMFKGGTFISVYRRTFMEASFPPIKISFPLSCFGLTRTTTASSAGRSMGGRE